MAENCMKTMFKPHAPHSTTHILVRDYARRTIDIALIHHPDLLADDEQRYITPLFTEGGIRKWGKSKDKNAGEYRDGNAPLQMDFANYTLGGLVKDRRNYDFEHNEHKRVLANIFWRIYDLGYSLDHFGEVDKEIARGNWHHGRSANGGKTDRYGKKYSWIAFYELAGFRQDKDLPPDYYDDSRISGADIDPSFPVEPQEYHLVTEDFLGDREISAQEWISKSAPPDLTSYLKVGRFCGEQGPWVLLDGSLSQRDNRDEQVSRDMIIFLRGVIVKSTESEEIVKRLKRQKIDEQSAPSCPRDYYTYAGEIPWCDTYPKNSWEELSFEIGTVLVPTEQQVLLRNGKPISEKEAHEFFNSIVDPIGTEDEEAMKARLRERDLEIGVETVEVEEKKYKKFKILVPVRENCWEDYHSAIVAGRSITTPSRQIVETLRLCGQPQSFDLFEKDGRCASITIRYGEKWPKLQEFTYLREDLLERYLRKVNGELIWVIWGERRLIPQNIWDERPVVSEHEDILFQDVKAYRHIQKHREVRNV